MRHPRPVVAISFLLLEGENLDKVFLGASVELLGNYRLQGKQLFIVLAGAVILPTTWLKNLGVLAYMSALGLVALAALTASLVWTRPACHGPANQARLQRLLP
jgi:vesicular inhibitory amino acid transporter